mgnify:CR=1 FL=1
MAYLESLRPYWGDLASLGSALSWSIAVIFFQFAGAKVRIIPLNIFKNTLAIGLIILSMWISGDTGWPQLTLSQWGLIALSGFLGVTLGDAFLVAALNRTGAGMQAIVSCVYAPMIIFFAYLMFAEVLPPLTMVGGFIVISAVLLSAWSPQQQLSGQDRLWGIIDGCLTHATTAIAILMVRDLFSAVTVLWLTAARLIFGQIALVGGSFLWGGRKFLFEAFTLETGKRWVVLATFFGTYLSLLFWMLGFKYTLAGRAAIYNQLSTIFIIVLATVILKEKFTRQKVLAVILAIAGATLVSLG